MSSTNRRFKKRQQKTKQRASRKKEGFEVITIPLPGAANHAPGDDCPICRMLAGQDPAEQLEDGSAVHAVDHETGEEILELMRQLNGDYSIN